MKKYAPLSIAITLAALLVFAGPVRAQFSDDVRNLYFDTLRTGDVQATPIGVADMRYVGTGYISQRDSTLMQYTTAVIRSDIDFYADFQLVLIDSFYLQLYEIKELGPLGWQRLGADYLLDLEAEILPGNLRVRWRLWDTSEKQQFAKGSAQRPKEEWRQLAHEISNDVVHTMTGEGGIFLTKICFIRDLGQGAKELFIADYDGANERQITHTGTINLSPAFAPYANEIYFTSYLGGDPALYRVNLENDRVSEVASYKGMVAAPAVSPDGDKIACCLTRDDNAEIYVLGLDGRIIKRLTRHWSIDTSPTWSPDGRMIAFSSDRTGVPQIYLMDSDGLNVRRLTFQGSYNDSPIWSAQGDRIVFVSRTRAGRFDLASIDTSGLDYRLMTQTGHNQNPHFSPDGKHIIFSSDRLGNNHDIYTADVTGRHQRRLTRYGGCTNPNWGPLR